MRNRTEKEAEFLKKFKSQADNIGLHALGVIQTLTDSIDSIKIEEDHVGRRRATVSINGKKTDITGDLSIPGLQNTQVFDHLKDWLRIEGYVITASNPVTHSDGWDRDTTYQNPKHFKPV